MHSIKHKEIEATINPIGAELSNLKVNGIEYLWQGDDRYWSGRAPILFPIVGALKDGYMRYQGTSYKMEKHGIVRRARFDSMPTSLNSVSMRLQSSSESLQQYPWQFELLVHFSLNDSGIEISYEVINKDEKPMLFTIGSHPAFALDINEPTDLENYAITVDQSETLQCYSLDDSKLLGKTAEPHDNVIPLSATIFNDDALIFRDIKATSINLVRNGQTMLTVDTGGAPHLGIWSKPKHLLCVLNHGLGPVTLVIQTISLRINLT